jgi:hypothetical protein
MISQFNEYCLSLELGTSQVLDMSHAFSAFSPSYKASLWTEILDKSKLPVPPQSGWSFAKTLHSLGVPRERLCFLLLWICNYVPYIHRECARCMEEISKVHLESCAVRSYLPQSEPGKGIDGLLHRAVNQFHAPSALRAMRIMYNEVTRAFPHR